MEEAITSLDNQQMAKLLETEKKKVTELEEEAKRRERSFHEMEENWRAQLDNVNKRLEEQATQHQALIAEEQIKLNAYKSKLRKSRERTVRYTTKYDQMVLENEAVITQLEEVKTSGRYPAATNRGEREREREFHK